MKKILIIDDDLGLVTAFSRIMEKHNFQVISAQDGLQGTMLAHNEKPDLIVLDLIMPLGGGITTLRNLKLSVHTRGIPIIVFSGTGDEYLQEEVLRLGIEHYVAKSCDFEPLALKIENILAKKE